MKDKVIRSIKVTSVVTILALAIDFLVFYFSSRTLSKETIGLYVYYVAIVEFIFFFVDSKMSLAYIKEKSEDKARQLIDSIFTAELAISLFVGAIWFVYLLLTDRSLERSTIVLVMSAVIILKPFSQMAVAKNERAIQIHKNQYGRLVGTLSFALVAVLIILKGNNLYALPMAYLARHVTHTLYLSAGTKLQLNWDKKLLSKALGLSLPLFLSAFVSYYYWNIDDIYVGKYLGEVALGLYWFSFYYPHAVLKLQSPFLRMLLPIYAKVPKERVKQLFEGLSKYTMYLMGFGVIISLLFVDKIVILLWDESWLGAVGALKIYTVLIALRAGSIYWNEIFILKDETKYQLGVAVLNAILITVFGPLLSSHFGFGILGMAIAVLITLIISFILMSSKLYAISRINILSVWYKPILLSVAVYLLGIALIPLGIGWVSISALLLVSYLLLLALLDGRSLLTFVSEMRPNDLHKA